jgi:CRISPR-associated Csx3 family protein
VREAHVGPAARRGADDALAKAGPVVIDVEALYRELGATALQEHLSAYERAALQQADEGEEVVLTGRGPIWLYLRLAHVLHGAARSLSYRAPEAGEVRIFDHTSR